MCQKLINIISMVRIQRQNLPASIRATQSSKLSFGWIVINNMFYINSGLRIRHRPRLMLPTHGSYSRILPLSQRSLAWTANRSRFQIHITIRKILFLKSILYNNVFIFIFTANLELFGVYVEDVKGLLLITITLMNIRFTVGFGTLFGSLYMFWLWRNCVVFEHVDGFVGTLNSPLCRQFIPPIFLNSWFLWFLGLAGVGVLTLIFIFNHWRNSIIIALLGPVRQHRLIYWRRLHDYYKNINLN